MVKAKVIQIEKRYDWDKLRKLFISGSIDDLDEFLKVHHVPDTLETWKKTADWIIQRNTIKVMVWFLNECKPVPAKESL